MRPYPVLLLLCIFLALFATAQSKIGAIEIGNVPEKKAKGNKKAKVYYGTASYYADKFAGRKTASGESYDHDKPTAACNILPFGTWIRVTNIKNKQSVIVKINDRLHPRMKRIVDLSKSSAQKLGYTRSGITQVKVEVLGTKK